MGADPTILFRGTVLQTAEFADSLYSPLFMSSLYHILIDLSRGFLKNPLAIPDIFLGGQLLVSWLHHQGLAFVIGISATLFQPVRSGSHLYPAHLHTVRSDRGAEVLPTLVGLSLWDCLALAFCTLIVSYFKGFVKNFFEEFLFHLCRLGICCSSSLTPLLYHTLGDLSRGNFRGCSAFCYSPISSLGRASSAFPLVWLRFPLPLPLTPI